MKVYISADIEGIASVTAWDETELGHNDHISAAKQMTKEVLAACRGAIAAGATEIFIKDGHDSARNILFEEMPDEVTLIRGWTNSPQSMVAGIDSSYAAAIFIGYHAGGGFNGNPLSHTMNLDNNYVKINGRRAAEFDMNAYVAAYYNVPVVFISGDKEICDHSKELIPNIETAPVKWGEGNATFNCSSEKACKMIETGVRAALEKRDMCLLQSPEKFTMEINFKECVHAYRSSFYPGAHQLDSRTVKIECHDIQEMMTARMFML